MKYPILPTAKDFKSCEFFTEHTPKLGDVAYTWDYFNGAAIFRFQWHHLPTGKKGQRMLFGQSSVEKQKALIDKWNSMQPNNWKYKRIKS